jgi:hypothetical protein
MVLGVYPAAWRRWFSLEQQVEELEAGPRTDRTQSADLGAPVADLRIEVPSVGVELSMGHRRVRFAQGLHGESRSAGLCAWLYLVITPHSQPSINSPPGTPWLKSAPSQFRTLRCRRLDFRLIRVRSRASASYHEAVLAQVTDGAGWRRTLRRSPENRKVGGSIPSLATTSHQPVLTIFSPSLSN